MSSKNKDSSANFQKDQEIGQNNTGSAKETGDVNFLDQTLRPAVWKDYIGQKNIKDN